MAVNVTVKNGTLEQSEIETYLSRGREKYGDKLQKMEITVCGDEVEIDYTYEAKPFHRIRRITGYLVGTLDRFNNAKRSEEKDRVKHQLNA